MEVINLVISDVLPELYADNNIYESFRVFENDDERKRCLGVHMESDDLIRQDVHDSKSLNLRASNSQISQISRLLCIRHPTMKLAEPL